jgi:hypothetical protein
MKTVSENYIQTYEQKGTPYYLKKTNYVRMKNSIKRNLGTILIAGLACFASCADLLETQSTGYLDTDDNRLNSANDSLYSLIGIARQMQALGERYVLLGELRGDLADVTKNASMDLQAIANFTATADNPYLSTKEYYAIINNCNYFLTHVDTSIISAGKKIMLSEYALVKSIRAWTYLQIGLNYGKASWITEPILTIDDMNRKYKVLSFEELVDLLIIDLLPFINIIDYTNYGSVGNIPISYLTIPVPLMVAELYMWKGAMGLQQAYAVAASIYYNWFTSSDRSYLPRRYYNYYNDSEFSSVNGSWVRSFTGGENISIIRYPLSSQENMTLPPHTVLCIPSNTSETYMIKPSQAGMDLWNNETYFYYREPQKDMFYHKGDLRGFFNRFGEAGGSFDYASTNEADSLPYITKYGYTLQGGYSRQIYPYVSLFRDGLLYLRYAEALNALEKPSLAFAVLKYGMKKEVLTDTTKIVRNEIDPLPSYCNFMADNFSNLGPGNTGIHSKGCANADKDTIYYAFTPETLIENRAYYGFPEALNTQIDSILFVNAMICKEYGLETAFEGNRFHDLMRLSQTYRNYTGKSDFLAKWVARRNPSLEGKLIDSDNWYLPFK